MCLVLLLFLFARCACFLFFFLSGDKSKEGSKVGVSKIDSSSQRMSRLATALNVGHNFARALMVKVRERE